jgi:murein L,D-transpeptidase YafK
MKHERLLLTFIVSFLSSPASSKPCTNITAATVVVETSQHLLWLCREGVLKGEYKVVLGTRGTGKQKEGDNKTPLGTYGLGIPRASKRFGVFIPVMYPTPEKKQQGFTGADVGIHGPARMFRWLGPINRWLDWTQGCIALAEDKEIEEIAAWVTRENSRTIEIR